MMDAFPETPQSAEFVYMLDREPCDMCGHEEHHDTDCGEVTGYDHLNGDHECGCPGALAVRLAQAWDEGAEATAEWIANNPGPSGIPHDPPRNPYDLITPPGQNPAAEASARDPLR